MQIPDYVLFIMNKLIAGGYECYLVGGCVRDALMGVAPHDYDIATSALPSEMKTVFAGERVIETGLKHGTLTVLFGTNAVEITTYRIDGEYDDNRHPREVSFTRSLHDDLSRRDFTVNAMAMSVDGEIIDLFGGREDLKTGLIKCVGEPALRFNEDGLRIMRALRFAATLDFAIAPDTAAAIERMSDLLLGISVERINAEFSKLICGAGAERIFFEFATTLHTVLPEVSVDDIENYSKIIHDMPDNIYIRRAALFCVPDVADKVARRLKFSAKERELTYYCTCLLHEMLHDKVLLALYIDKLGYDLTAVALETAGCSDSAEKVRQMQSDGTPISVRSLNVDGNDVMLLGIRGATVGMVLNQALIAVINGDCKNERSALIDFIKATVNGVLTE